MWFRSPADRSEGRPSEAHCAGRSCARPACAVVGRPRSGLGSGGWADASRRAEQWGGVVGLGLGGRKRGPCAGSGRASVGSGTGGGPEELQGGVWQVDKEGLGFKFGGGEGVGGGAGAGSAGSPYSVAELSLPVESALSTAWWSCRVRGAARAARWIPTQRAAADCARPAIYFRTERLRGQPVWIPE